MVEIIKAHGSGNCFFLIDQQQLSRELTEEEWRQLAITFCSEENNFLGGADGILAVLPATKDDADGQMRIFNQDGSEASMCGNGLRIVARYLIEKTGKTELVIQTQQANLSVKKASPLSDQLDAYQVEISPVHFDADSIGMTIEGKKQLREERLAFLPSRFAFSAVAVPNPHLIAFVEKSDFSAEELQKVAELVNQDNPWFPEGINVSFVTILGTQQLFVQTYERGVGFTNACGTAMSASSLMYVLEHGGEIDSLIEVRNPGGMVRTKVHTDDKNFWMELIGNATYIARIQIDESNLLSRDIQEAEIEMTNESEVCDHFIKAFSFD